MMVWVVSWDGWLVILWMVVVVAVVVWRRYVVVLIALALMLATLVGCELQQARVTLRVSPKPLTYASTDEVSIVFGACSL